MILFTFKRRCWLLLALLSFIAMGGVQVHAQETLIKGVESLAGIDPTAKANWVDNESDYNANTDSKTIFLYNVGTGKFVNMGGAWGTHAALHTTPKYFFLFNNVPDEDTSTPKKLNIRTKQSTNPKSAIDYNNPTSSTDYMQYIVANKTLYNPVAGVYFDRTYNNVNGGSGSTENQPGSNGWTFVRVGDTSSATNFIYNIYQVVGNQNYYLVAQTPDKTYGNDVEAKPGTPDAKDKNAQWKLISKGQYFTLFNKAPADLSEPTDASFLLRDPDFSVNNRYVDSWNITGNFKLGTDKYYKTKDTSSGKLATKKYTDNSKDNNYQLKYGRFFNACITSATGEFYQYVTVTKPGWFLFRCRGISNVTGASGHVNAVLYAQQYSDADFKKPKEGAYTSQSLNTFPQALASATVKDKMLAAGQEFSQGKYENQVMLYVEPQEGASTYYIRFGVKVGDSNSPSSAKGLTRATSTKENLTIFDSFRMLYAGTSEEPDLILDEDNTDLYYLTDNGYKAEGYTTPVDKYTNTTLHLMRKFKLNMWNTIILPVNLNYGQMKGAFGDDVKLASLWQLTDNTMRFLTVEKNNDDDVMLEANKPYIIYPTKGPGTTQAYTATLHHVEKVGSTTPAEPWTGTYQGNSVTDGRITIAADHYLISKVTLDTKNINKDAVGTTWVPQSSDYQFTASNSNGTMVTTGTLAKTYTETNTESGTSKTMIEGRYDCGGSYIMNNGAFYLVPEKKQYGLKAFRTWFKYTPTSAGSKPTTFSFFINDEEVPATAIQDLFVDEPAARMSNIPGVYSLSGERLRMGNDLTGLPSGIYIVNGQKYVIK